MFFHHVDAEEKVDIDFVDDLQRTLDHVAAVDFQFCGMDAAHDRGGPHADSYASEPRVHVFQDAAALSETVRNNRALCACVDEGLELRAVELHVDVQHGGRNETLGQVFLGVLPGERSLQVAIHPVEMDFLLDFLLHG